MWESRTAGGCFRTSITPLPHLKRAGWQRSEAGRRNWALPSISAAAFHPLACYKCMLAVLYRTCCKSGASWLLGKALHATFTLSIHYILCTCLWPQASGSWGRNLIGLCAFSHAGWHIKQALWHHVLLRRTWSRWTVLIPPGVLHYCLIVKIFSTYSMLSDFTPYYLYIVYL